MKPGDASIALFSLAALVLSLLLLGSDAGHLATRLRGVSFDAYQRIQPRTYIDTMAHAGYSVRVLDADAASLARFGPWPWPRSTLAALLAELKEKGAALAVLAFPLDIPDPLAPSNLAAQTEAGPAGDAARAALEAMVSPDIALKNAMSRLATATGFTLITTPAARAPDLRTQFVFSGVPNALGRVPDFAFASAAIAPLDRMSAGRGALNLPPDADGVLRRMPLLFRLGGKPVPALSAEILRLIEHRQQVVVRATTGALLGLIPPAIAMNLVTPDLPTAPDGSFWIAFSGKRTERDVSAAALDAGSLESTRLVNAVVILAPPGETIATPLGNRSLGDVYAEALENALSEGALHRPADATLLELVCLALAGIAVIALLVRSGVLWSGLFTAAVIVAAFAFSWYFYSAHRILIDAFGPSLALGFVFGLGAASREFTEARTRSRVRVAFAQTLPASVVGQIARNPEALALDGVSRTITYLCCGTQNFAANSEAFTDDAAGFTRVMRRVLAALVEAAVARGATLDHLAGDGFSAVWNAPLDDSEHAIHACEAASAMLDVLAKTNDAIAKERKDEGKEFVPIEIGVGIATGDCVSGGFNIQGRTVYSVFGDCTLVARRIQQLSAQYGASVIVADETRHAAERGFAFLEVDHITAGAHDEPLKLHALLGSPVMRASPKFRAMLTFHEHIFQSLRAQQWSKARELIEQCRKLSGASQKLYDLHLSRIAFFQQNPPGPQWDGAFRPSPE